MYYPLRMHCKECNDGETLCQTTDVSFNVKGDVLLDGICPKCKHQFQGQISLKDILDSFTPAHMDLADWKPTGKPS